jgi:hypothetical protein
LGFSIRKSFKVGPLRLNLSKSGLGASVGTKGAQLGLRSKGKLYTHLGRWGLYHRQDLGSVNPQAATSSKGIGFWILIGLGILLVLFIALSLVTAADRLDVFGQEGRRAGHVTAEQRAGRLDLFNHDSRRTGYGFQRSDGSWDLFRPNGSPPAAPACRSEAAGRQRAGRLGIIQPGPAGLPSRLVLPPRKREPWPGFGVGGRGSRFTTVRSSPLRPPRGPMISYWQEVLAAIAPDIRSLALTRNQAAVAWTAWRMRRAQLETSLPIGLTARAILARIGRANGTGRELARLGTWLYRARRAGSPKLGAHEWRHLDRLPGVPQPRGAGVPGRVGRTA